MTTLWEKILFLGGLVALFVLVAWWPRWTRAHARHHRLSNWLYMRRYRAAHPQRRAYPREVRPGQAAVDTASRGLTRAGVEGASSAPPPAPQTLVGAAVPRPGAPTRLHRRQP